MEGESNTSNAPTRSTQWQRFLNAIPSDGWNSPAFDVLLDTVTEVLQRVEDTAAEFGEDLLIEVAESIREQRPDLYDQTED